MISSQWLTAEATDWRCGICRVSDEQCIYCACAQGRAETKPHYRLHCKVSPTINRMLGQVVIVWRCGEYGAWFSNPARAIQAAAEAL